MTQRTTMPYIDTNFHETKLGVFIDSRRANDKKLCSFTGMGAVTGKFMVKDEDYQTFLDLLHEYLFTQQRRPLNLVEQRRTDLYSPILIDLDFKYPFERAIARQFELSHIHKFIQKYVENLELFYDLSEHKELRFFISLRPAPYEDKKNNAANRSIKDGVHIECPDLVLHTDHQQVLRHKFIDMTYLTETFKNTGYINSEKDIFDEAIVKKNGWFFYGESKPDIPAYSLSSVYVYNPKTREFYEQDVDDYSPRQLLEILSIRYNLHVNVPPFKETAHEEWQKYIDVVNGKIHPHNEQNTIVEVPIQINTTNTNVHEQLKQDEIALAKQLATECLSAERAEGYQTWMEVAWCLHNIDPSEDMFNTWLRFSEKSGKAGGNNVNALLRDWNKGWNRTYRERQYTIRSLHMWAKMDNPKKYYQIMNNSFIDFVEREVDATHTHIARLMKRMYGKNYCAAVDSKKTDWYEFTGSYWKKLAQGIELRNKMTTEVAQVICDARSRIRGRAMENGELNDQRFIETRMKQMMNIEKCLYTAGFKDSVMKECQGLFYEEEFAQKLNSNQFLLGFNNGVLDLRAIRDKEDGSGEKEYYVNFRKSEPTDFISYMAGRWLPKQCEPIDYVEYDPYDPEQADIHAEIDDFMEKVFPRHELREYMWKKLAACLEGANREQTYETWIGVGGNGKSKLVDLMSMTLGDYATSLQSTAMTRKRPESGAANPDIMAVRNKRFIYMAEPDDREPLNTSRMKQFSGEDVIEARGLFEDQCKFQITGKMFMLCNAFPAINTMDNGTWRRIRVVPFESKFVDPKSDEIDPSKHIYPRDNNLDAKLRKWRTLFMSRLVHIYKTQYLHNGIGKEPDIVLKESNKYKESFDSLARFMNAHVIEEAGFEASIREIYNEYVTWYTSIGGGVGRKLSQTELYKRLSDRLGEPADKKTFKRFHLFKADEDIEEYRQQMGK